VGIYATNQIGNDRFEWSELSTFDYAQVSESLEIAERNNHIRFGKKALFGFSQGGCVAAELSSRYPQIFAGAVILSPGANTHPGPLPFQEGNRYQKYYLSCGADEAPGNLAFTHSYAKYLSITGASVHSREVPGMKDHTRPPDWADRFPEWIAAILAIQR
jgi:predicted esterase